MNKSKLSFGVVLVLSVFLLLCCSNSEKTLSPPGLGYHSMAYDSESEVSIIFGGQPRNNNPNYMNITWAYRSNDDTWTEMTPEVKPPAYTDTTMVYDSESDRIILFTGQSTWSYDYNSNEWQKQNPARSPVAVIGFRMSYDLESDRVILFGIPTNETWVYDYNSDNWTSMHPEISPPVRQYSAMAYDSESDRIVLFGGGKESVKPYYYSIVCDDTWLYDYNSNSWTEVKSISHPEKRVYHTMVYNPAIDRVILFGGWSYDDKIQIPNAKKIADQISKISNPVARAAYTWRFNTSIIIDNLDIFKIANYNAVCENPEKQAEFLLRGTNPGQKIREITQSESIRHKDEFSVDGRALIAKICRTNAIKLGLWD